MDIAAIPDNPLDFEVSQKYNRWELHNEFGGQRYRGIATPSEDPLIFIFTGGSGENYGYDDEFLDDGSFLYSGEGTEGDMTMEGGNEALRVHKEREESVHLFEETEYPWIVTYAGEYEYDGHQWDTLPDENGENRDGIRFRLVPVGGTEIHIDAGPASSLSEEELFEKAKQSSPTGPPTSGVSSSNSSTDRHLYKRSDIVKDFALRVANGVCQGCEEPAPFVDGDDDPFLEVHHIQRLSDDGPDDPENVIAVCPNCHRRVHYGRDGDEFDRELKQKAETRNEEFQASD
ncbi:HNH endonuclease [Halobacteriales archaeon QS_9_67_17]|nr:MAG: HNH endonuclease [Halobacteriales archaeon QS_9_67_17]